MDIVDPGRPTSRCWFCRLASWESWVERTWLLRLDRLNLIPALLLTRSSTLRPSCSTLGASSSFNRVQNEDVNCIHHKVMQGLDGTQFAFAAVTNYHKLSGLKKQHRLILLQFWSLEIWNESDGAKLMVSTEPIPSSGCRGECLLTYSSLGRLPVFPGSWSLPPPSKPASSLSDSASSSSCCHKASSHFPASLLQGLSWLD